MSRPKVRVSPDPEFPMETLCLLAQQPEGGGGDGGALAGLGALVCVFWVLGLLAFAFWLWMLIDALTHEPTTNDKILWVLVIVLLPVLGSLIYFVVRKRGRRAP